MELFLYPAYISIFLPIVLYAIPYLNTQIIKQETFIKVCHIRMGILLIFNYLYLLTSHYNMLSDSLLYILIGGALVVIGQILNFAVYSKLGVKGVYYGIQYKKVKFRRFIDEFPFYIYHPQYLGGAISYIGVFFLYGYKMGTFDGNLIKELLYILIVQSYLVCMETILDKIYSK